VTKHIALLVRNTAVSPEAFMAELQEGFARRVQALPGVHGLIVHGIVREMTRADIPVLLIGDSIDAILEWWVDPASASAVLRALPDNIARFKCFTAEEDAIIPLRPPRAAIKTMAFLRGKDGDELQAFRHKWHHEHGSMARVVPYLQGFILNDLTSEVRVPGIDSIPFGMPVGVAEGWLESPEAQQKMVATREAKAWFAHGANSFGEIKSFLTRETLHVKPPQ
jgi:hypothetical protein